jgi:hypothetical protein
MSTPYVPLCLIQASKTEVGVLLEVLEKLLKQNPEPEAKIEDQPLCVAIERATDAVQTLLSEVEKAQGELTKQALGDISLDDKTREAIDDAVGASLYEIESTVEEIEDALINVREEVAQLEVTLTPTNLAIDLQIQHFLLDWKDRLEKAVRATSV